jgi:hypothetical protein
MFDDLTSLQRPSEQDVRTIGRDIFTALLPSNKMRRMRRAVSSNVFSALLSSEEVRVMGLCICCNARAALFPFFSVRGVLWYLDKGGADLELGMQMHPLLGGQRVLCGELKWNA